MSKKWLFLIFISFVAAIVCTAFIGSNSLVKRKQSVRGSGFCQSNGNEHPKIVNIVNFIRLLEPRDSAITEDVLYQTVVKQVDIMKKYKLRGTFLLQYDALIDPRYQK